MARRDTKSYPSLLAAVLLSCLPALRVTAGLPGGAKITAVVLAQGVLLADALPPALGGLPSSAGSARVGRDLHQLPKCLLGRDALLGDLQALLAAQVVGEIGL